MLSAAASSCSGRSGGDEGAGGGGQGWTCMMAEAGHQRTCGWVSAWRRRGFGGSGGETTSWEATRRQTQTNRKLDQKTQNGHLLAVSSRDPPYSILTPEPRFIRPNVAPRRYTTTSAWAARSNRTLENENRRASGALAGQGRTDTDTDTSTYVRYRCATSTCARTRDTGWTSAPTRSRSRAARASTTWIRHTPIPSKSCSQYSLPVAQPVSAHP